MTNGMGMGGGLRVVSLLPSATEIVCLIGGAGLLVGRSHECDYPVGLGPQGLGHVPVLTSARTHADALAPDSAAIDRQVREVFAGQADGQADGQAGGGASLYTLDVAMLEALRPDVIITQDLCDVCSIDLATVRRVAAGMTGGREGGPKVVSLNPETIEGILDSILTVGRAIGRERSAIDAVVQLRERLFAAQEFVNPFADGPVVGFLEWTDPLYCAGHWNVQLIERAGGQHPWNATVPKENAGAAAGPMGAERVAGKSVRVPEELFVACRPEAVIIAPCGYSLAQAEFAAAELAKKAWWGELPAVKKGRVAVMDGNAWFNRPGPRVVDAFEWMVEWLGRG